MSKLYNKISQLCKSRSTNVTEMCKELGISRASLSDLKLGRTETLSIKTLTKIANYFDTTVDNLLSDNTTYSNTRSDIDPELSEYLEMLRTRPEMRMMFELSKGATKEDVEKAVKIIEAFLGK